MGRRRGGDKLFQRNREKEQADFARKMDIFEKQVMLLLAFEGTKTEPNYFDAFFQYLKKRRLIAKTSVIFVPHSHTDPNGVLNDLLNYEKDGLKSQDFEHRWIVIDRDPPMTNVGGHTAENFNNAISRSKLCNVQVAYSNPCFEIWFLLHFHYRNTSINRHELCNELDQIFGYQKNYAATFHVLEDKLDTAIRNAKMLKATYEVGGREVQPGNDNPLTTVFELIEFLQSPNKGT